MMRHALFEMFAKRLRSGESEHLGTFTQFSFIKIRCACLRYLARMAQRQPRGDRPDDLENDRRADDDREHL